MTYDALRPGGLDYLPCRYGNSKLMFRGPKRKMDDPFVAFLGGIDTYGRFIRTPFPELVERNIGVNCINFGIPNAGVDAFTKDTGVMEACRQSKVAVVQIVGAQNMTNRLYSVHPRRNDRFLAPSELLKTIYREVDFAEFHYTKHMLSHLYKVSQERFAVIRSELESVWMARMRDLLSRTEGKVVLLWLAHRPAQKAAGVDLDPAIAPDPLFISREMVDALSEIATDTVEVVATPEDLACGTQDMYFSPLELPVAKGLLGPRVHEAAANSLVEVLNRLAI